MRAILVTSIKNKRTRNTTANAVAYRHTIHCLKHPDPEGPFAQKTRWIRWLYGPLLFWLLCFARYDGFVFLHEDEDRVVGHVFFQAHAVRPWHRGLHFFAVWVTEELRGTDCSVQMVKNFLLHAYTKGWRRVRLGTDRNPAMRRLRERVAKAANTDEPFKFVLGKNGWATLEC